jgi:hypothetical protein
MPALPTNIQGGNPDVVLSQNYGHVGRLIAYAIMQRGEEDWKRLVEARVQQWGARLQVPPTTGPDRFRVALCAIADIGVALSRSLGFALDADAVGRAVKQVCDTMVTESAVLTISNETILYRFIADNISRFGRVMYSPAGRSVVPEASREVNCGEIRITMAADNRVRVSEFYIVLHKLMEYVKRNKLNETDFRKWVIKSDRTEFIGDFVFMAGTQHTYRSEGLKVDIMALGESSLLPQLTKRPRRNNLTPVLQSQRVETPGVETPGFFIATFPGTPGRVYCRRRWSTVQRQRGCDWSRVGRAVYGR